MENNGNADMGMTKMTADSSKQLLQTDKKVQSGAICHHASTIFSSVLLILSSSLKLVSELLIRLHLISLCLVFVQKQGTSTVVHGWKEIIITIRIEVES